MTQFNIGSLVHCRGREWVVLPSPQRDLLMLRPLGGGEAEICGVYLPIEPDVRPAEFPPPDPARHGDLQAGQLLRDAARFALRSGAGPFRSFGHLNIRPRPYQLVPLIMALRLHDQPVRMLIADDVGIGKTIEAGLIARELLDRGQIQRLVVLCPPHLCEQWQRELQQKFGIEAVVVRSSTVAALERAIPNNVNLFEHYPFTVTSIDFVKGSRWRSSFVHACPELVIVDEAHTATASSTGNQQQRYQLLRDLAERADRHMVLLTATPHSGIEDAFRSILGLLRKEFAKFDLEHLSESQRRLLAKHFVQRRRADVQSWLGAGDHTPFPQRTSAEVTYTLSSKSDYYRLYADVYEYTKELIQHQGETSPRQRARYWAALALLRCVMSSPAAAEKALKARAKNQPLDEEVTQENDLLREQIYETAEADLAQDVEPSQAFDLSEIPTNRLERFARRAAELRGAQDLKLQGLIKPLRKLLDEGFNPIIYCRYIATANYLAEMLDKQFGSRELKVVAVTGERTEEEREQLINGLAEYPRRLLVATDCMSEGINLQRSFDAVIHYDLPWNPNRLEQREGRVDRYGQPNSEVRTMLYYGENNPIDEVVMKVLLRKARSIHRSLGISVPLPLDTNTVLDTMIDQLYKPQVIQHSMFESFSEFSGSISQEVDVQWEQAAEREKVSRTRFAQHAIKPEEVARELAEVDDVLGDPAELEAFVRRSCQRLNIPLKQHKDEWQLVVDRSAMPAPIADAVAPLVQAAGKRKGEPVLRLIFDPNTVPQPQVELVGRNHPLVAALADYLLDQALSATADEGHRISARCGMIRSTAVQRRTILLLLRVRLLITHGKQSTPSLAEELVLTGMVRSGGSTTLLSSEQALELMREAKPSSNTSDSEREQAIAQALSAIDAQQINELAQQRAAHLRETYHRLTQHIGGGQVTVEAHLPPDLLGVYVLLPEL
jgi:superfamily II DNA or RNA helicase